MNIAYCDKSKSICIVDEDGKKVDVTIKVMEAVSDFFYNNYGSYSNQNGEINYTFKD